MLNKKGRGLPMSQSRSTPLSVRVSTPPVRGHFTRRFNAFIEQKYRDERRSCCEQQDDASSRHRIYVGLPTAICHGLGVHSSPVCAHSWKRNVFANSPHPPRESLSNIWKEKNNFF